MSSTAHHHPLKMKTQIGCLNLLCTELKTANCKQTTASTAAADTSDTAVVAAGHSAALVSFQWQYASHPPTQNVDSAPRSLTSARHFSGKYAIFAKIAVTIATNATFQTFRAS